MLPRKLRRVYPGRRLRRREDWRDDFGRCRIGFHAHPSKRDDAIVTTIWRFLTTPIGPRYWTPFLVATGVAGAAGIALVLYYPSSVPLVWLWMVGIPANSPLSPLFPTAFEPLMMEAVKYQPVIAVTVAAVAILVYMEFINWYVYALMLNWDKLEPFRDNRWVRWGVEHFGRAPYLTVFVFAVSPLPFWVVRALAILNKTPFGRYLAAMAVGRFPRAYVYAWLGAQLRVPTLILVTIALGTGVVLILWRLAKRQPILEKNILATEEPERATA